MRTLRSILLWPYCREWCFLVVHILLRVDPITQFWLQPQSRNWKLFKVLRDMMTQVTA